MRYGEVSSNGLRVRRRDKRVWFVVFGMFVSVFLFSFLAQRFKNDGEVGAASLAGFDPGYIISDYQMGNYSSMSEAEIQNFLTSKNPCNNRDYNYYRSLSGATWHWENGHFVCLSEERFGDGEVIGSGDTAAHIIWQTAQDYRINPQVLLVLLQKETGLITDPIPNNYDYRKATGYGCPDTAACSSKYYGFKNQLRNAAALFRAVLDGGWTNYPLGDNYIQYNPNAACGGSVVNIRSLATSALYRYTPYQPNAGALAAGYGTASCGAYGNRNFYLYFEDWFGGITYEDEWAKCSLTVFCDMPSDLESTQAIRWMYDSGITQFYSHDGEFAPDVVVDNEQFGVFLDRYQRKYPDKKHNDINHLMNSFKDGDIELSRAEAMHYLYLLNDIPVEVEKKISDLPDDYNGRLSANWAYNSKLVKYYNNEGEFAPYANVTRREVMIFLWRLAGEPSVDTSGIAETYRDLPDDDLGRKAITWASRNNLTKYYNNEGEFAPYANVTRREVMIFLWRLAGEPAAYHSDLLDLPEETALVNSINWAYAQGITKYYNNEGEFAPYANVTRREVAIFFYRMYRSRAGNL